MRNMHAGRAADRRRKGTTLVELSITLALLSLIAVLTISFCTLIGKYVQRTHDRYDFLHDCGLLRSELSDWLSARDDASSLCLVSAEELQIGGDSVIFSPDSRELQVFDNGRTQTLPFDSVTDITFSVGSDGADGLLLKCTVTGASSERDADTMSFLLPFHLGTLQQETGGE